MHQPRDYPSSPLIPEEEEEDRPNRFLNQSHEATLSLRERAASQPPKSSDQPFPSPAQQYTIPSSLGRTTASSWMGSRRRGLPINGGRSSSFSSNAQVGYGNSLRESLAFESTFEDDESVLDSYDESRYMMPQQVRGRSYGDPSRSRSQSLATPISRPITSGSPYIGSPPGLSSWKESVLSNTNPLNIPGRYGEIKPPGTSRYGSLGALGRSPANGSSPLSSFHRHQIDPSNQSPFMRDVGQIMLDDGSALRELWAGMNPPKDEVGGGGSGTTSRRHSVSVVQPRRAPNVVGFNAPEDDVEEKSSRQTSFPQSFGGGRSGLMLTDDDLASDLNSMSIGSQNGTASSYQESSRASFSRQSSGYSPPRNYESADYDVSQSGRFGVPGHMPQQQNGFNVASPTSPTVPRPPYYGHPQPQRRTSDAPQPPSSLADIGKGVPLHSVPPSWPLFIVEFKAGRTDLFYLTDLTQDIHIGDLVLVEADRGKDLGKVVNDTITLTEVEEFQRLQVAKQAGDAAEPTSPSSGAPGAAGATKKEINPKMIYGKATSHDVQLLHAKIADEAKALQLCQTKVEAKKLPMQVIDAEYQWDRRKLTFYFVAEKRIDFRELVRELFRLYKTRIWMASLQGPGMSFES